MPEHPAAIARGFDWRHPWATLKYRYAWGEWPIRWQEPTVIDADEFREFCEQADAYVKEAESNG